MLNKLLSFVRQQDMLQPGDTLVCAVSGGADSVALLFAFYLLKEKLGIHLEAAHFNHNLRGEESDRDEKFVRELCHRYDIPVHVGSRQVIPGKKGLEAAARDARYAFFDTLPGKIATAHTADDNAETVLMHLVRGTGLRGLGGIAPIRGRLIRPMLLITRTQVEAFLQEWCLDWIQDSSNDTDDFLRNRLRHHVMPLLAQENPRIGENLSRTALGLREDEAFIAAQWENRELPDVPTLRSMPGAQRSRALAAFLQRSGVKEPEQAHIDLAERLVFSEKPSARAAFPGGVTIGRQYDALAVLEDREAMEDRMLPCPGEVQFGYWRIICQLAEEIVNTQDTITVIPQGELRVGSRRTGDSIRLHGGSKALKKLYIDRKIPASQRPQLPVVRDDGGILGVAGFGPDQRRAAKTLPAVTIRFEWKG